MILRTRYTKISNRFNPGIETNASQYVSSLSKTTVYLSKPQHSMTARACRWSVPWGVKTPKPAIHLITKLSPKRGSWLSPETSCNFNVQHWGVSHHHWKYKHLEIAWKHNRHKQISPPAAISESQNAAPTASSFKYSLKTKRIKAEFQTPLFSKSTYLDFA